MRSEVSSAEASSALRVSLSLPLRLRSFSESRTTFPISIQPTPYDHTIHYTPPPHTLNSGWFVKVLQKDILVCGIVGSFWFTTEPPDRGREGGKTQGGKTQMGDTEMGDTERGVGMGEVSERRGRSCVDYERFELFPTPF